MPVLYRVFPHLENAPDDGPGGALFIPRQGGGRLDNPAIYSVLYLSDSAAGAIAEAFGRFAEWTPAILEGGTAMPGSVRAIASYSLPDDVSICDLNDPYRLIALDLLPCDVVTRDYERSRAWARRIWERGEWSGVRWWSYYDPRWSSIGLWDAARLKIESVRQITMDTPELAEAGRVIVRRLVMGRMKRAASRR